MGLKKPTLISELLFNRSVTDYTIESRPTSCNVESILKDDRPVSLIGECNHESFGSSMVVGVVEGLRVDQQLNAVVDAVFNAFAYLEKYDY